MAHTGHTYTLTIWKVKAGKEEEFVRRWTELVDWSAMQGLSGRARLLRDHDDAHRFISFGPWETLATAKRWRSQEGLRERLQKIHEVVDVLEPHILETVVEH